jgi:hypothetical protein
VILISVGFLLELLHCRPAWGSKKNAYFFEKYKNIEKECIEFNIQNIILLDRRRSCGECIG